MVSVAHGVSIVAFAYTLAQVVTRIIDEAPQDSVIEALVLFAVATLARGITLIVLDVLGVRGGVLAKRELREALIDALARRGARWLGATRTPHVTSVMTTGLDALDNYFGKYLPQLLMTIVVTPIVVGALYVSDLTTGIAVTVMLPLIPLFMALVGWATQNVQKRQWQALTQLAEGFVDTVEGLSTLKIFGRHHRQRERIGRLTDEYRTRTMKVLRVSFLSAFVLELAASLSVAVVAVSVGIRLISEDIPLSLGLFVLLLVPEVFIPLRAVGTQFHSAAEGLQVASDAFDIIEAAPITPVKLARAAPGSAVISLDNFQGLRSGEAVHRPITTTLQPGTWCAVVGPSGAGKSTFFDALLGFGDYRGSIRQGGVELGHPELRGLISWAPQTPDLTFGTVGENLTLGADRDTPAMVTALRLAGLPGVPADSPLGVEGAGLSGGQAQRLSLARCYYRALTKNTPLLLLDEVTSALDSDTENQVVAGIDEMASRGFCLLVITHRPAVAGRAHATITVSPEGVVVT